MEPHKLVLRYVDGRVLKGHTNNFGGATFHLLPHGEPPDGRTVEVEMSQLKAAFFVKDFQGVHDDMTDSAAGPLHGRPIEILFSDGERLQGKVLNYEVTGPGFFMFPTDPHSNNIRVYVVRHNVKDIQLK